MGTPIKASLFIVAVTCLWLWWLNAKAHEPFADRMHYRCEVTASRYATVAEIEQCKKWLSRKDLKP
jgi:hypothetical protein